MFVKRLRARNRFRHQPSATERKNRRHRSTELRLELLEERTLLSAPDPVASLWKTDEGISQLGNAQTTDTASAFLGSIFEGGASVGKIRSTILGKFGATGHLDISGKAGVQLEASVNSGTVAAQFNQTLRQDYVEPTMFGEMVTFSPASGTGVSYSTSGNNPTSFSTTSPSFGASASLELGLHAELGAKIAVFDTVGGDTSFGGELSLPLFSFNQNNDRQVKLFDVPVTSGVTGQVMNGILGLNVPIAAEPVPTRIHVSFENHDLEFLQRVFLEAYYPPPQDKPAIVFANPGAAGLTGLLAAQGAQTARSVTGLGVEL